MNEKTLEFGDVVVNKKEFCDSKKQISLNFVGIDRIVVSDNFKHKDKSFRYFVSYTDCYTY